MSSAGPEPEELLDDRPAGSRPEQPPASHWAEEVARRHLEGLGWRTLAVNYRLRGGELDLVMQHDNVVVVVEVRQRRTARFGSPAETIDQRKLIRLRRTAQHFLSFELRRPGAALRLDAVVLLGDQRRYQLMHIEDIG